MSQKKTVYLKVYKNKESLEKFFISTVENVAIQLGFYEDSQGFDCPKLPFVFEPVLLTFEEFDKAPKEETIFPKPTKK